MTTQSPTRTPSPDPWPSDTLTADLRARVESTLRAALPGPAALALAPAIAAERNTMRSHRGHVVSYYEDRRAQGRPLASFTASTPAHRRTR